VAILEDFATRKSISFPLLADPGSLVIRRFGLLNEADYPPGRIAHGVPYPGTFVTDAQGRVRAKYFEKAYAERRTAASLLSLSGESTGHSLQSIRTAQFALRPSLSNETAAPGQRVTLILDFEMGPRMHAYAPGVTGYRSLRLLFEPQPLVTLHETAYPPAQPYRFEPLRETVAVFEGRFRITRDVTVGVGRDVQEALQAPEPRLTLAATLEYQVCSDKVCFPPSSLPLSFGLKLIPLDRERVPDAIQHKAKKQ